MSSLIRIVTWSHELVREVLRPGDLAVDLTAGKGRDTLALAADSLVVAGELRIDRTTEFRLVLEDAYGLANQSPLVYEVAAAVDQVPAVNLERPGDDGILPIAGELKLEVEAADDFGMSTVKNLGRRVAEVALRVQG